MSFKDVLKKAIDIKDAWTREVPVNEQFYKDRVSKCFSCEHNTLNGGKGNLLASTLTSTVDNGLGVCSLCSCPVYRKASIKRQECPDNPKRWEAIETEIRPNLKGSLNDMFDIEPLKNVISISKRDNRPVYDLICNDTESSLYLEFKVKLLFEGKVSSFREHCSCTKGFVEKVNNKEYIVKVSVTKEDVAKHTVSFEVSFTKKGVSNRGKLINLYLSATFNKL